MRVQTLQLEGIQNKFGGKKMSDEQQTAPQQKGSKIGLVIVILITIALISQCGKWVASWSVPTSINSAKNAVIGTWISRDGSFGRSMKFVFKANMTYDTYIAEKSESNWGSVYEKGRKYYVSSYVADDDGKTYYYVKLDSNGAQWVFFDSDSALTNTRNFQKMTKGDGSP